MTEDQIRAALPEVDVLALTMWAEARGDSHEGHSSVEERIAVGCVIRNRVLDPAWWGNSFRTVCLKHAMFSCWLNDGSGNHASLIAAAELILVGKQADPVLVESRYLADGIRRGLILDRVGGADHYYAPKAMRPAGTVPTWAKTPAGIVRPPDAIVGDQHFYHLGATA